MHQLPYALCLLLLATTSLHAAGDPRQTNDLHARVDLPDGATWVLGKGGIGRPFMARLLLTNRGKQPIHIWDHNNSEGSRCPGVTLTDAGGKVIVLRPAALERSAGVPTVLTIPPDGVLAINRELLRLIGDQNPAPGPYTLAGFYENKLKNDGAFIKGDVWTGRIESEAVKIRIAAPPRE